jgi:hypothetical protein
MKKTVYSYATGIAGTGKYPGSRRKFGGMEGFPINLGFSIVYNHSQRMEIEIKLLAGKFPFT